MFYVCRKFCALMEDAAVLKVTCAAQTDAPASKQVKSARTNTTDPERGGQTRAPFSPELLYRLLEVPAAACLVLNHGILSSLSVSAAHVERRSYFPAVVPCSDTAACPDKYTCCKDASDKWTCCPLEQVDTHTHTKCF